MPGVTRREKSGAGAARGARPTGERPAALAATGTLSSSRPRHLLPGHGDAARIL